MTYEMACLIDPWYVPGCVNHADTREEIKLSYHVVRRPILEDWQQFVTDWRRTVPRDSSLESSMNSTAVAAERTVADGRGRNGNGNTGAV